MKNLEKENIYRDEGVISSNEIARLESGIGVTLPILYTKFIIQHNGARLNNDCFDFYDNNREMSSSESIAFLDVTQIQDDMNSLLHQSTDDLHDPDIFKFYHYFDKRLIPFGETGGGDFICFDYRNYPKIQDPPVIYWCHDADELDERISFISNNFEEFIDMLHEPEY
jgi:cell wall assembly regulator SMI1